MAAPTSSLPPYEYQGFAKPDNSLRLLKLRSAKADQDGIDCELFEAKLIETDSFQEGIRGEEYEAVSWCWGDLPQDCPLRINDGERAYSFPISRDLQSALRALRYEDRNRLLWVDAICINQKNLTERNQQVPKMNQIYGQAKNVCIWVGDEDETSHQAIEFIREKVLKLWDFDKLCEDSRMGERWHAMSMLMKRPWFSRRWAVKEIALAERGILYCGKDKIFWQDFADAVSLFVEAESITHKLSNVMRKDQKFDQIPDFYGNVPALGAARLVDATSNLFRSSKNGKRECRERLLSLEYLVSKYTVFEAREPRDTIYALLAIARDTTPQAIKQEKPDEFKQLSKETQQRLGQWFNQDLVAKVYPVDYNAPPIEVYKDFIAFSISKSEPKCALNIICRPWAPRLPSSGHRSSINGATVSSNVTVVHSPSASVFPLQTNVLPSWIPDLRGAAFVMQQHANAAAGVRMDRSNADPLVGMPGDRPYSAAGTKPISIDKPKWLNRGYYYSMFVEGFVFDTVARQEEVSRAGIIPPKWLELVRWDNTNVDPLEEFWHTLVADRGPNGQNTQPFYPRACKEAMTKRPPDRGVLDTKAVIEHGRCSIIAEFLRRVQAVIWNRRLVRTKNDHLGLVHEDSREGDHICILYGCNVPVLLRKFSKSTKAINKERREAEEDQRKRDQDAITKVRAVFRVNEKQPNATKRIWTDPTCIEPFWICVIVLFAEYRHNFSFDQAALLNCLFLTFPQPFERVRKSMDRQFWNEIRKWVYALRLAGTGYLVAHMALSIHHPIERAFITTSLVMLLPLLFISGKQRESIVVWMRRFWEYEEGDWVRLKTSQPDEKSTWLRFHQRYAGPYRITKKISSTHFELDLPPEQVPDYKVFNVNRLEKVRDYAYIFKAAQYINAASNLEQAAPVAEPEQYYWQLIGECYVDGMMDGEAIAYQNEKRATIKPQIFELR